MSPTPEAKTLFDLSGGHPALDLVNSLDNRFRADGPNENLVRYTDLLRFARESGLLENERLQLLEKSAGSAAAAETLRAVKELREAAAVVCYATMEDRTPPCADIRTLERHFREAGQHRMLCWTKAESDATAHGRITWQWPSPAPDPKLPLWMLSQAVADLLLSSDAARIRTCAVDTCRWLFLDTSKNHTRRWCNMKVCGNRMKARRFQARREGQ